MTITGWFFLICAIVVGVIVITANMWVENEEYKRKGLVK